jgi:SAM-dependent methyltransferase
MSAKDRVAALSEALEAGDARPLSYPSWYMRHRHFLPGGYLSARSAALYERLVAPLYNLPSPAWVRDHVAASVLGTAPRRILELGCGTGALLATLRQHLPGTEMEGVDLSPFLLEQARAALSDDATLGLHHADAASFAGERPFDAVVAVHLLGHIPVDHARAVFANAISNLVAPGGVLHIVEHRWHRPVWGLPAMERGAQLLTPLLVHRSYTTAGG